MLDRKKKENEEIIVRNRRTSYKKKEKNDEIFPKDYLTGCITREKDKILSKRKGRRKEKQTK